VVINELDDHVSDDDIELRGKAVRGYRCDQHGQCNGDDTAADGQHIQDTADQDEFYAIAFRKKIYRSIAELQADLDRWMYTYNNERTHSGKYCFGKTLMQTFTESIPMAQEKLLERLAEDQILQGPHEKGAEESESMHLGEKKLYSQIQSDNL
jgi:hypothetical protein